MYGIEHLRLPQWASRDRFENFQRGVLEEILGHYQDGVELVVLDAPTGAGKSLLAMLTAQALNLQTIYACDAIVLQHQLENDFPEVAVIKGRSNYEPQIVEPVMGVAPTCADCDYDKDSKLCTFCDEPKFCPYSVAKREAITAAYACMNYAYLLGECNSSNSGFTGRDFIIADECDTLESQVMNYVSIEISPRMQRFLDLDTPSKKTKEDAWQEWFDYAVPHIGKKLQYLPEGSLMQKRQKSAVVRLLGKMNDIAEHIDEYVYTGYSNNKDAGSIEFKPVVVDRAAPEVLWQHGRKWLAMSATVISPEEFVDSLGFQGRWEAVFAPSTFPKERRPIYYAPVTFMTKKKEETAMPMMAEALSVVAGLNPKGRMLVHSHSYKLTKVLHERLTADHPDRGVFAYFNSQERAQVIAEFENTEDAILVAPSLDRGYDGKDDLVRFVVVCKMPYLYLGDKQVSTRLYKTKTGQKWYAVNTARSIVQMVGRGMRHEDDFCQTIVLDSVFGGFYSDWVANGNDGSNGQKRRHRLFPEWFVEALDFNSDLRFELRQELRRRKSEGVS